MTNPKSITTYIADVEVVYYYTYSRGTPPRGEFGPIESYDPGSGSEIDLDGPYILDVSYEGNGQTDISGIIELLPAAVFDKFMDGVLEQIELQEADAREDARTDAAEYRRDALRDAQS